jgi:lipoate-protein ligase A
VTLSDIVPGLINARSIFTLKPPTWRLIDTGLSAGSENMAIDEALLSSFNPRLSKPILRLYGWTPATLSLGRFQKSDEVLDLDVCRQAGMPFVRRISGGGVICHADELTYSIICSPDHLPAVSSVKDSFRSLTGFILEFYRRLGLAASYAVDTVPDAGLLGSRTAFCFAGKESFDIVVAGRKIGGNAQRRKKDVIFQHGSIPLLNWAERGLGYMMDRNPEYAQGVVSLADCGVTAGSSELKLLLVESFKRSMNVQLLPTTLTDMEQQQCRSLLENKYSSERWNMYGDDA